MKSFIAAASIATQSFYVLTLAGVVTAASKFFQVDSLWESGDPKLMAGVISQLIIELFVGAAIGLVGVFLAWSVLRSKVTCPPWFLPVSTLFAWAWVVFIPIGTLIGVLMLRWCRPDEVEQTSA